MKSARKKCVICGSKDLEVVYKFKSFPVYMGISDRADMSDDEFADMVWMVCKRCGCIQLKNLIRLSLLYHKGHNSAYGKTWEQHHREFSKFIIQHCGSNVLEIGGGNLKLANFVTNEKDIQFTVMDTNLEVSSNKSILTKNEFFDYKNYKLDYMVDTIVHSHVMEHFYEPIQNIRTFANMLDVRQKVIMSVPLLDVMLKDKFTNSINFEHTYMLSEPLLRLIMNNNGFRVIGKKLFNPYNIFMACEKVDKAVKIVLPNSYKNNLSLFIDFINFHKDFVEKVNRMKSKHFYVFGGHIFSQFLFAFGLDSSKFVCVLDNDPKKIGKRLYGTSLFVKSPKILADVENPIVILRAAQFSDEIKNDILTNINDKTIFVEK